MIVGRYFTDWRVCRMFGISPELVGRKKLLREIDGSETSVLSEARVKGIEPSQGGKEMPEIILANW